MRDWPTREAGVFDPQRGQREMVNQKEDGAV